MHTSHAQSHNVRSQLTTMQLVTVTCITAAHEFNSASSCLLKLSIAIVKSVGDEVTEAPTKKRKKVSKVDAVPLWASNCHLYAMYRARHQSYSTMQKR